MVHAVTPTWRRSARSAGARNELALPWSMTTDPMTAFEVFYGAVHVDTLYYNDDMSAREVRRAEIDRGAFTERASVYKRAKDRHAFSDCARASHPEEC